MALDRLLGSEGYWGARRRGTSHPHSIHLRAWQRDCVRLQQVSVTVLVTVRVAGCVAGCVTGSERGGSNPGRQDRKPAP